MKKEEGVSSSEDSSTDGELRGAFDGLGFQVRIPPFTACLRAEEGVVLSRAAAADDLKVAVARSSDRRLLIVNRERFAVKRLHDQVGRVIQWIEQEAVRFGGLQGFRSLVRVESLDPDHEDEERLAAQVVLFAERGYFVVWTELDPGDSSGVELFDGVAGSLVRVDGGGRPITREVPSPSDVEHQLERAFELAVQHDSEDGQALGELYLRYSGFDEDDRTEAAARARAYGAEAWFLRFNVETLAGLVFGREDLERFDRLLRERLPGFSEATYRRAMSYARGIAEIDAEDDP